MNRSAGGRSGKRRIAVVVPKYGLVGGGERFVFELTERMARDARYEFHVFANRWRSGPAPVTFHKVPMIRFPRTLRPGSFAWFADRMIAAGAFDLVHAHDRVHRADVVSMHFVPHAGWVRDVRGKPPSLFDRATVALERRMMRNCGGAWFLPVSSIAADAFRREYAVDAARVRIVPPGVDAARFAAPDRGACRAEIRGGHGIGENDLVVLFVGMNFEVKGLGTIVEAVAKVRRARPEAGVRLLVVGRGDEPKYRKLALSLGIADAVTFAGVRAEGVERYYRASDVFAMLSTFDTFGMAVLEAMAAGLPVIVGPNVGAKDLVGNGVNGFVLPDGRDPDAAAGGIGRLAEGGVRRRMGEAAMRTASEHSWETLAAGVAEIYEECFRAGGRAGAASGLAHEKIPPGGPAG